MYFWNSAEVISAAAKSGLNPITSEVLSTMTLRNFGRIPQSLLDIDELLGDFVDIARAHGDDERIFAFF